MAYCAASFIHNVCSMPNGIINCPSPDRFRPAGYNFSLSLSLPLYLFLTIGQSSNRVDRKITCSCQFECLFVFVVVVVAIQLVIDKYEWYAWKELKVDCHNIDSKLSVCVCVAADVPRQLIALPMLMRMLPIDRDTHTHRERKRARAREAAWAAWSNVNVVQQFCCVCVIKLFDRLSLPALN